MKLLKKILNLIYNRKNEYDENITEIYKDDVFEEIKKDNKIIRLFINYSWYYGEMGIQFWFFILRFGVKVNNIGSGGFPTVEFSVFKLLNFGYTIFHNGKGLFICIYKLFQINICFEGYLAWWYKMEGKKAKFRISIFNKWEWVY